MWHLTISLRSRPEWSRLARSPRLVTLFGCLGWPRTFSRLGPRGRGFAWRRRQFHVIGEKPHHADAEDPSRDLPGPDRGDPEPPARGGIGVAKDPVADHRTGADGKDEPEYNQPPGPRYQTPFLLRKRGLLPEEDVKLTLALSIILGEQRHHGGDRDV